VEEGNIGNVVYFVCVCDGGVVWGLTGQVF
jgi:hypothetical protein